MLLRATQPNYFLMIFDISQPFWYFGQIIAKSPSSIAGWQGQDLWFETSRRGNDGQAGGPLHGDVLGCRIPSTCSSAGMCSLFVRTCGTCSKMWNVFEHARCPAEIRWYNAVRSPTLVPYFFYEVIKQPPFLLCLFVLFVRFFFWGDDIFINITIFIIILISNKENETYI